MKKFFVYCSANQAYEALTFNDILCSEMKGDTFKVATLSFMSNNYVFISTEKINSNGRNYGISEQNNQYPVTLEISGIEECDVKVRFVIRAEDGKYVLDDLRPLSEYSEVDDCLGAFVYGHIPFSLVSRIIFENVENKERFAKSGSELWFPEYIYSIWTDDEYKELCGISVNTGMLRDISVSADAELTEDVQKKLKDVLNKRFHAKAAYYYAVEATEKWNIGNIATNIDSAVISMLDDDSKIFRGIAQQKLNSLTEIFEFINPDSFTIRDSALENVDSSDFSILKVVIEEISKNSFKLDKDTVNNIKSILDAGKIDLTLSNEVVTVSGIDAGEKNIMLSNEADGQITINLDSSATTQTDKSDYHPEADIDKMDQSLSITNEYQTEIDAIATFAGSRLGKSDIMLEATRSNDILYALAICLKNKGMPDKVKIETAEMSQAVKRYALIISGFMSNMASISGTVKSNRILEKSISQAVNIKFTDTNCMLIRPIKTDTSDVGIVPTIKLKVDVTEFKALIESASEKSLEALYKTELAEKIPEESITAFNNEIKITMDDMVYTIGSRVEADMFITVLKNKFEEKENVFSKKLFIEKAKPFLGSLLKKYQS